MRLPPTRKLAAEFGIARNVVIDAYEQLIAEGYLIGQSGSGTYVAGGIRAGLPSADEDVGHEVERRTDEPVPPESRGPHSISRSERRICVNFLGSFGRNI
ncbi:hypothetical protein HMSSN139_18380 [Paenibacillus sp. HMSSN-139]|nr:hypothetical protein HMSSN139_18380 [Paenibacillus sp. HMSSN-139]